MIDQATARLSSVLCSDEVGPHAMVDQNDRGHKRIIETDFLARFSQYLAPKKI
ncbi:hypothetical protein PAMC26577_21655 [Caballeronia sordidicola]|uniref:Uncharacterized protein n=1 Tax=Caballeronia sordidicola TaxID=196367 RepID=A0A242MLH2_CABSO|nr:hypothetical protein PAMC26577_21655 [Caballeronia sordidicola]